MEVFKYADLLGVPFSCCEFDCVLKKMSSRIEARTKAHIAIANTETVYHATRIKNLLWYIKKADFSCCDGAAISLIGKTFGYDIPRLHGPDLLLRACDFGRKNNWRHFFYGGKKDVPEKLIKNLCQKFPGMKVAGMYSPPIRPIGAKEDASTIQAINDSKPDIIWIGLGLLKQWRWIEDHRDIIDAPIVIGIGAAFDFHAGTIKRAPESFRKIGLEWLYRLYFEPRMLKRNLLSLVAILKIIAARLQISR